MQITNVKLLTSHIDHLRSFYTQNLGLPLINDAKNEFTVKAGESSLTFVEHDSSEPFYHFAFDIPGTAMDASIQWLDSIGVSINRLPNQDYKIYSQSWNSTSIYFYDPAGKVVEFIARHNLAYPSSSHFSGKDLISISEIGLVVTDVPKVMEVLKTELQLESYKENTDKFAAVGDEKGLFILSAYNRVWLGSDKKAKIFKTEITLRGHQEKSFSLHDYPYHIYFH